VEAMLTLALQDALIATLVIGSERLPEGAWNDKPLSLAQAKALQGSLPCASSFTTARRRSSSIAGDRTSGLAAWKSWRL